MARLALATHCSCLQVQCAQRRAGRALSHCQPPVTGLPTKEQNITARTQALEYGQATAMTTITTTTYYAGNRRTVPAETTNRASWNNRQTITTQALEYGYGQAGAAGELSLLPLWRYLGGPPSDEATDVSRVGGLWGAVLFER